MIHQVLGNFGGLCCHDVLDHYTVSMLFVVLWVQILLITEYHILIY